MPDDLDLALRTRIHAAVDAVVPDAAARGRIVRGATATPAPPRRQMVNLAVGGLVALAFAGALGTGLVMRHHGTAPAGVPRQPLPTALPSLIMPSPSPSLVPTVAPTLTPSPSPTPARTHAATLSPAVEPPAAWVTECSNPLTRTADGNVNYQSCGPNGIDVPAWNFYASIHPQVMKLGHAATQGEVQLVLCADLRTQHITLVEEWNAALLAGTYYGWSFNEAPLYFNTMTACPR